MKDCKIVDLQETYDQSSEKKFLVWKKKNPENLQDHEGTMHKSDSLRRIICLLAHI